MSTILFNACRPVKVSRTFGQGVFAQRDRELPIGPSAFDLQWAARELNATADASDGEWADEFERRTMSVLEYRTARLEAAAAQLDRYLSAEEQEMAEWGLAPVDPATIAPQAPTPARKPKELTLHQISRAKRLGR